MPHRPPIVPLLVLALVGGLAGTPACTRPVTLPSPTSVPVDPAASGSPAAPDDSGLPAPFPSPSAGDAVDPSQVSTAAPSLGPARLPLPPGKAGTLVAAPSPPPGAPGAASPTPTPTPVIPSPVVERTTVVSVAKGRAELTKLVAALEASGLAASLLDQGPFTVFGPTNAAFDAMPAGTYAALLRPENKGRLLKVLTYHVVPGAYYADVLRDGPLGTQEGQKVLIDVGAFGIMFGDARVVKGDDKATNGVIHQIDRVLIPPDLGPEAADVVALIGKLENQKTLTQALDLALLVDAHKGTGPFTVFAPTDGAFEKLPEGVLARLLRPENKAQLAELLKYHVVPQLVPSERLRDGGLQTLNGAGLPVVVTGQSAPRVAGGTVALADTVAGNGVVHVVDTVLVPPGFQFP